MKSMNRTLFLAISVSFFSMTMYGQNDSGVDSTGLPGDNFSLQGALQMFQNASSVEDFEKALNTENNHVNNLDLNGDGDIDYIRVVDKADGNTHAFILTALVSDKESQDIAVIELEKTGKENAMIQIVGDEDIYGEEVIVEPNGEDAASVVNENYYPLSGPNVDYGINASGIIVNVWFWPSVRFVYGPVYTPWISPWRWRYYPTWWRPWRPFAWHVWHPFRVGYHRHFVVCHTNRIIRARKIYKPYRTTSVIVRNRHAVSVNNYHVSRKKTTVVGPKGNKATIKKTTVRGPKGNKATRVKVRKH